VDSGFRRIALAACYSNLLRRVEIYRRVKDTRQGIFRPTLLEADDDDLLNMVRRCWAEEPNERPDFNTVKGLIKRINKYVSIRILCRNTPGWGTALEQEAFLKH